MRRYITQIFLIVSIFAVGHIASAATIELTCDHLAPGSGGNTCYFFSDQHTISYTSENAYTTDYPDTSGFAGNISGSFAANSITVNDATISWDEFINGSDTYYFRYNQDYSFLNASSTNTRLVSSLPINGDQAVATTTSFGGQVYVNPADFEGQGGRLVVKATQDQAFYCANSLFAIDAFSCTGANSYTFTPVNVTFDGPTEDLLSGLYDLSKSVTFPAGGKWTATYEIQKKVSPWYYLGVFNDYTTIVSTTTQFVVGYKTAIDIQAENIASSTTRLRNDTNFGISSILASTTASLKKACNIISTGFDAGDCLTLVVIPPDAALHDDFNILQGTPPLSYAFRTYNIFKDTVATTSLPQFSYKFGSTSPFFSGIGTISFSPFESLVGGNNIIANAKSDQDNSLNVWQIMSPVVHIIVYLMLAFMIIKDLTGVHIHATEEPTQNTAHSDEAYKLKETLYKNKNRGRFYD